MADLTTLPVIKEWLRETTNDNDALLSRMLSAASGFVQEYIDRDLTSQVYTEYVNGNGKSAIFVANYPVTAIASLEIGGSLIQALALGASTGVGWVANLRKNGRIDLINRQFNCGVGNVKVVYTAGYSPIPASIVQVVCELVGVRYKEQDRIGLVSKSLAGETIAFTQKDMSSSNKTALGPFRRTFMP